MHDLGLIHDLETLARRDAERRRVLGWLGASALTLAASAVGANSAGQCVASAEETPGPFPSNGSNSVNGKSSNVLTQSGIVRSDIRSSFGSARGAAPGVPLALTISLVDAGDKCSPLAGRAVYLWHCSR